MPLTPKDLPALKTLSARLHNVLTDIVDFVNLTGRSTGIAPAGHLQTPPAIGGISVTAANGYFDIQITDKSVTQRGLEYFAEWDTTSNFTNARTIPMGVTRNWNVALGNLTTYWRGYSMFVGSETGSPHVVFGGNTPTAVVGGGSAGPVPQATQGSGLSQAPGYGFGPSPKSGSLKTSNQ